MADKSFGVKELNLLNASGTPTVTSPNNLNLNANTVAISTSCTIGNNLTVTSTTNSANLNITGIGTLTRAFATDLSVSGVSTITVPANANPHSSWDVVNNSASAYRFTGPGQDGAEDNPDIYLVRGQRYVFKMNASGHPFQIRVSNGGSAYSDGVTNNGSQTGNVVFNVQHDAPAHLFYQCTSHGSMVGNIYIVGQHLANGADNRVLTATSAYGMTGESGLTFSSDRLILTNTSTPQIRINNDTSDGSGTRFVFGKATANNNFFNGAVAGDSCIGFPSTLLFGVGASEKLRIDSSGNFNLGLTASPVSSSTEQGVFLAGAESTQSVISSNVTPFVVNRVGTGGNDRNCIELRNNGVLRGTIGAIGGSNGIFFQSATSEVLRIGSSGQIGIAGANYGTSGQVLMSQGSGSAVQWASPAYIIHDVWALSSSMTTSSTETKVTTWSRANAYSATIGSAMTESSGIFTFPETGIYKVVFDVYYQTANSSRYISHRIYKVISATSTRIAQKLTSVNTAGSQWYQSDKVEAYFDVTNVSTHKIEFTVASENATTLGSGHSSSLIQTAAYFTKIGDT